MARVLVVDDDPHLVRALRINLQARKFEVESATDGTAALQCATRAVTVRSCPCRGRFPSDKQ